MKKLFLTVVAVFAAAAISFAQDVTKPVVNVQGFKNASDLTAKEVFIIRQNLISALQATKRVIVVDLANEDMVDDESERRKAEATMGDTRQVGDVTKLQANFILSGLVKSVGTEAEDVKYKDASTGREYTKRQYTTSVDFSITLINPATGATESVHDYSSSSTDENADASRTNAVNGASGSMKKFIEECFPVKGEIIKVDTDKKGVKAVVVYVNIGSDDGIAAGQKIMVFKEEDIAGEISEKHIGEITVTEVNGKNRATCKVNKGGEEIVKAKSQDQMVTIQTRAKKEMNLGLGNLIKIN